MGQSHSQPDHSVSHERNNSQSSRNPITDLTYQSSPDVPEDEQSPPPAYPSEQREWHDLGAPVWPRNDTDGETTRNPFMYGGSIPDGVIPKNVILFGETGVGKSSVINLMAGVEIASTSPNLQGCTLESEEYSFLLDGQTPFRIYDTVGLNEPDMGVESFFSAVEKAHKLVTRLHAAGGIDLLFFCIRGRITATVQRNYRLFFEILGAKSIPLALIVTHLEHEDNMENWWERNEETFQAYDIRSVAHACITAAPARVTMLAARRQESRRALQRMFHEAFSTAGANAPFVNDVRSWFVRVIQFFRWVLMKNSWIKKKLLSWMLESRCGFSSADAERLADMLARES